MIELFIIGSPDFNLEVAVNGDPKSMNGIIRLNPGDRVEFAHEPLRFWHYYDSTGKIHRLDSTNKCFFTVPEGAAGIATLYIRHGMEEYHYDLFRLDRSEGWVRNIVFSLS